MIKIISKVINKTKKIIPTLKYFNEVIYNYRTIYLIIFKKKLQNKVQSLNHYKKINKNLDRHKQLYPY